MSTTATVTEGLSASSLPLTIENVEYRIYAKVDNEGNVVKDKDGNFVREIRTTTAKDPDFKKYEQSHVEASAKLPAENQYTMQVEAYQTVARPKFGTLEAFQKYFDDDPELIMYIINLGVGSRYNQKVPKSLLETDESGSLTFPFAESVYDPRDLLTEEVQKRNLSPMERAQKELKKLAGTVDIAALQELLAQLQASSQS